MKRFALSVLGKDRPGIVAGVTKALFAAGCNIEDSAMTLLRSEFAMILLVSLPPRGTVAAIERALKNTMRSLSLSYFVRPLKPSERAPSGRAGSPWIISVYGADKPGIVHAVSALLAVMKVNITDVQTKVTGPSTHPVYCMFLETTVPARLTPATLKRRLAAAADRLNVTISLTPADVPTL